MDAVLDYFGLLVRPSVLLISTVDLVCVAVKRAVILN